MIVKIFFFLHFHCVQTLLFRIIGRLGTFRTNIIFIILIFKKNKILVVTVSMLLMCNQDPTWIFVNCLFLCSLKEGAPAKKKEKRKRSPESESLDEGSKSERYALNSYYSCGKDLLENSWKKQQHNYSKITTQSGSILFKQILFCSII